MRCIDLFCGAGGSTLGAKMAGHTVTDAYDINPVHLDAYHINHPDVNIHQMDILELSASDLPETDIIMGSTPCESFSLINMTGRTDDMVLTDHFLQIVRDYKPRFWVMENVPMIAKYLTVPYRLLCAANYGVPQSRVRCMAGNYPMPVQTHAKHPCGDLKPWVTFGVIKDPEGKNKPLSKKALAGAYERGWLMGFRKNKFKVYFIDENDVLNTVTASENHGLRAAAHIIYDGGILRNLTFLETARAQSFPDGYVFCGNQAQKFKQVGQAVPPLMMKAILGGV